MNRTLTALFDTRADAEAAEARLKASNIDAGSIHIHDQGSEGFSTTDYSSDDNQGFWSKVKNMAIPEEDRHTYEEGVRRGGVVLTAEVESDQAEEAARLLEQNSVDIDQRAGDWRKTGWDYKARTAAAAGTATGIGATAANALHRAGEAITDKVEALRSDRNANEERIPIVEERLQVGKREVDRGGVKVRSYVVETPVQEKVTLRDENVSVDRRPVNRPLEAGEDAFKERTVEMTARGEEAVIGKQAHVKEELVIRKDAGERTETIDDTVRRTEVEIDKDRSAFAGTTNDKRI